MECNGQWTIFHLAFSAPSAYLVILMLFKRTPRRTTIMSEGENLIVEFVPEIDGHANCQLVLICL